MAVQLCLRNRRTTSALATAVVPGRPSGSTSFALSNWRSWDAGSRRHLVTADRPKPMKRFYKGASVKQVEGSTAWSVTLDGKAVRTPKGSPLQLPSLTLAEAVAEEWESQGDKVLPLEMPMTTLGCTALDLVRPDPAACIDRLLPYLETDTVCFEDENERLAELQLQEWGPLREWFGQHFGVSLGTARGLAVPQHREGTLDAVGSQLCKRDEWELCALEVATTTAKSLIVAAALLERPSVDAEQALRWALLEEHFQIERWGLVEGEHDVSHEDVLLWMTATRRFVRKRHELPE